MLSTHQQALLSNIIAIADRMDIIDRHRTEFGYAQLNLEQTIGKLRLSGNYHNFDFSSHHQCRESAQSLISSNNNSINQVKS